MTVFGLLKYIENAFELKPLSDFEHKKIAIDANLILHSIDNEVCKDPLCKDRVEIIRGKVDYFLSLGIEPVIVFEGDKLDLNEKKKEKTFSKRAILKESIQNKDSSNSSKFITLANRFMIEFPLCQNFLLILLMY